MVIKNKRLKIKKVRRRQYNVLDESDRVKILSMYHRERMTQEQIADKFGTTRQNISKILKKAALNNIEVKGDTMYYCSDEVLRRRDLAIAERQKLITQDATEVAELTLSLAKYRLNAMANAVETEGEAGLLKIDIEKLMKLLQTALPYLIAKPELKGGGKQKENSIPQMHLHKSMKLKTV